MKNKDPIFHQSNDIQQPQTEETNNENDKEYDDDYYDKTDRDEEEMQEINFFLNNRSFCKIYDVILLLTLISIITFVWVYICKLPIPEIIKVLFGLDDTQYPTPSQ